MVAVRREHTNLEALLSSPVGFLSALEAQGELRELLDALYGEAPGRPRRILGGAPLAPVLRA
jgi:hypothetical protein